MSTLAPLVQLSTATAPPAFPLAMFSGDFLYLAIAFFVLAILAAVVGARGVAGISMEIARILILVFLVLAVISLLL